MAHDSPSFTIKLITHKVKTLSQKIYSRNSQINQLVNRRNNSLIAHDFYFSKIMTVLVTELNPKMHANMFY